MVSAGNHKEYFCTQLGEKEFLILSAEKQLLLGVGGHIDGVEDCTLYIYAWNVGITSRFKVKNLLCSCRSMVFSEDAVIDVSGQEGESKNLLSVTKEQGEEGGRGEDGGWVCLFTDEREMVPQIKIEACGGNGGIGQSGVRSIRGGKGGDAGNGGRIQVYSISSFTSLVEKIKGCLCGKEVLLCASDLFDSIGVGESKQHIVIKILQYCLIEQIAGKEKPETLDEWESILDDCFIQWSSEQQNDFLRNFLIKLMDIENENYVQIEKEYYYNRAGVPGMAGEGIYHGEGGKKGKEGEKTGGSCFSWAEICKKSEQISLHPQFCQMLYNKAVSLYMTATNPTTDSYNESYDIFCYLCHILQGMSDLKSKKLTEEDCKIYQRILEQSYLNKNRMELGEDYYGQRLNFVPRLSFDTYFSDLKDSIDIYRDCEKVWTTFLQEEKQNKEMIQLLEDGKKILNNSINQLKREQEKISECMNWLMSELIGKEEKISQLQNKVEEDLNKCIEALAQINGYSVDDFVSAIGMLGFAPNSHLIQFSQVVDFINKSENTIVNMDGIHLNKQYILKKAMYCRADWKSLKEGIYQLKNGSLETEDGNAVKLLANKEEIEQLLEQFYDQIPYEDLKKTIEKYCSLVLERNEQIVQYNEYLIRDTEQKLKIIEEKEQLQKTEEEWLNKYSVSSPEVFCAIQRRYQISRDNLMELLYRTDRALQYYCLSFDTVLSQILDGTSEESWDYAAFAQVIECMKTSVTNMLEKEGAPKQKFVGKGAIQWTFSREDLDWFWEMLKKYGYFEVDIPEVNADTTIKENPFTGMSEVRIEKARPFVKGICTTDNILRIELIQGGQEVFYNSDNVKFNFVHSIVKQIFRYENLECPKILEDIDYSQKEGDKTFALISPFTRWRISIPDNWNTIDWEQSLKENFDFRLEFWGEHRSF